MNKPYTTVDGDTYSDTLTINEVPMINQRSGECGDRIAEDAYYESKVYSDWFYRTLQIKIDEEYYKDGWGELFYWDDNDQLQPPPISFEEFDKPLVGEYRYKVEYADLDRQGHHEQVCGYWYSNVVKDEYTYTIVDLPRDREIPSDYEGVVRAGVAAGLNAWAKINDMNFTYTDSRLHADIIIQQQIGNGRMYGNAEIGCLFDNEQCTMQLFTDINVRDQQTLVNRHSIAWTVAHEFGHMIGLPHHIDPDHIMNTVHSNDVRTYYEARNINVVQAPEPTYEQRLLGYEGEGTFTPDYSDAGQLLEHATTIEFIAFVKEIAANTDPSVLAEYINQLVLRIN